MGSLKQTGGKMNSLESSDVPPFIGNTNVERGAVRRFPKSPAEARRMYPLSIGAYNMIYEQRQTIERIIAGEDKRMLVFGGPCSVLREDEMLELAHDMMEYRQTYGDVFYFVLRAFPLKPRTRRGWQGIIMEPHLDGTSKIGEGVLVYRNIVTALVQTGVPVATEILDAITYQWFHDAISWAAIGARNSEVTLNRAIASGLSVPVGVKNGTGGSLKVAVDGLVTIPHPNCFPGVDDDGFAADVPTLGNKFAHMVMRGGDGKPNYQKEHVELAQSLLRKENLRETLIIDSSHDNCMVTDPLGGKAEKDYRRQIPVFLDIVRQRAEGNEGIVGTMCEWHIKPGSQKLPTDLRGFKRETLEYGLSVTDGCIGRAETQELLKEAANILRASRK